MDAHLHNSSKRLALTAVFQLTMRMLGEIVISQVSFKGWNMQYKQVLLWNK
jgi:hypothetical protein